MVDYVSKANWFIRFRWIGLPLFITGIVLFLIAGKQLMVTGRLFPVMLGVASTLIGLTCFGLNHDTAIEFALLAKQKDAKTVLSEEMERELADELQRDKAHALGLRGNKTMAMVLPLIALCVQGTEVYLLFW